MPEKNDSENSSLKNERHERMDDFHIIFDYVPGMSGYQMFIILLVGLFEFAGAPIITAQILLHAEPDAKECIEWDSTKGNLTEDGCPPSGVECEKYNFTSQLFNNTVVTEWNLVCQNSYKPSLISSVSIAGVFWGAIAFGYIGDQIGRMNGMALSAIGSTACVLLTSVASVNLTSYTIFRFLSSCFSHGAIPLSAVYVMEYVGEKYMAFATGLGYVLSGVGIASLSLVGYCFQNWRQMNMMLALYPAICFLSYFVLPKSIRYLYSAGDYKKGKYYLKQLMTRTKSDTKHLDLLSARLEELSVRQNKQKMESGNSMLEIFSRNYFHMTCKISWLMFVACLTSFGFLLNPAGLKGNLLYNNMLITFFDMLGYCVVPFFSAYFGRVKTLTGAFWTTGICIVISSLFTIFYPGSTKILTICKVLVFIGKIASSISFGVVFNYVAELYPTHLRTTALGFGSAMARIGGILAPQMIFLQTINPLFQPVIIGSCAFIAGIISARMPETNNRPLMQTTEEALLLYNKK